jgi:hypothetical protein
VAGKGALRRFAASILACTSFNKKAVAAGSLWQRDVALSTQSPGESEKWGEVEWNGVMRRSAAILAHLKI